MKQEKLIKVNKKLFGNPKYLLRIEPSFTPKYNNPPNPLANKRNEFYDIDEKFNLNFKTLEERAKEYCGLFVATDKGFLIEGYTKELFDKEGKAYFNINDNISFLLYPDLKNITDEIYHKVKNRFFLQSPLHRLVPNDIILTELISKSNKNSNVYHIMCFEPGFSWFDESKIRYNGVTTG